MPAFACFSSLPVGLVMVGSCINCVLIEGMNNEGRATL